MKHSAYANRMASFLANVFFVHTRTVAVCILLLAGCIGAWIIYSYLFVPYTSLPDVPQSTEIAIRAKELDTITAWIQAKAQAAQAVPVLPDAVFFVPPPL